jgi:hypothetical protein
VQPDQGAGGGVFPGDVGAWTRLRPLAISRLPKPEIRCAYARGAKERSDIALPLGWVPGYVGAAN